MTLNARQQRFVAEYTIDFNATQAAIRAGYSPKTAYSIGSELLKKPEIADFLRAQAESLGITVERVLRERARIAFYDVRRLFHQDGRVRAMNELDGDTAAGIQGFDVATGDDGSVVLKYRLADKNASLMALEKHLGIGKDTQSAPALNIRIDLGDDAQPPTRKAFDLFASRID